MEKLKGQVFLMSILLLTIVSVAGIIVLTVFNRHLKMSYEIGESIRALFVADSCIEWQVYNSLNPNNRIPEPSFYNNDPNSGVVKCSQANKVISNQRILYSGTIKNISRVLEVRTRY